MASQAAAEARNDGTKDDSSNEISRILVGLIFLFYLLFRPGK